MSQKYMSSRSFASLNILGYKILWVGLNAISGVCLTCLV